MGGEEGANVGEIVGDLEGGLVGSVGSVVGILVSVGSVVGIFVSVGSVVGMAVDPISEICAVTSKFKRLVFALKLDKTFSALVVAVMSRRMQASHIWLSNSV